MATPIRFDRNHFTPRHEPGDVVDSMRMKLSDGKLYSLDIPVYGEALSLQDAGVLKLKKTG